MVLHACNVVQRLLQARRLQQPAGNDGAQGKQAQEPVSNGRAASHFRAKKAAGSGRMMSSLFRGMDINDRLQRTAIKEERCSSSAYPSMLGSHARPSASDVSHRHLTRR